MSDKLYGGMPASLTDVTGTEMDRELSQRNMTAIIKDRHPELLTLDQCVGRLSARLTVAGHLQELTNMKTNVERVRWILNNYETFNDAVTPLHCDGASAMTSRERVATSEKKSEENARQLRLAGNALFTAKRYKDSLVKYNQAVLSAPRRHDLPSSQRRKKGDVRNIENVDKLRTKTLENGFVENGSGIAGESGGNHEYCTAKSSKETEDGVELSLALANRSAALFHLKRYGQSTLDADLALSQGYPRELSYKLHERRARCYQQLLRYAEAVTSLDAAIRELQLKQLDREKLEERKSDEQPQTTSDNYLNSLVKLRSELSQKIECTSVKVCDTSPESLTVRDTGIVTVDDQTHFELTPILSGSLFDAVEIQSAKDRGRFTVSKKFAKVGQVLSAEHPFMSVLFSEFYKTHCQHCLRVISTTSGLPYPCRACMEVVYCSPACSEANWSEYHRHECGMLNSALSQNVCGREGLLAYRMLLVTDLRSVRDVFTEGSCSGEVALDVGEDRVEKRLSGSSPVEYAAMVSSLVGHEEKRDWKAQLKMCTLAFFLTQIVEQNCDWLSSDDHSTTENKLVTEPIDDGALQKSLDINPNQSEVIMSALLRHLQIIECNSFVVPDMIRSRSSTTSGAGGSSEPHAGSAIPDTENRCVLWQCSIRDIALAMYQTHSLLNHSCDPSVEFSFRTESENLRCSSTSGAGSGTRGGSLLTMQALRTIYPGAELTVDYGRLFFTAQESKRQHYLADQYYFDCRCNACTNHWPLWDDLPSGGKLKLLCSCLAAGAAPGEACPACGRRRPTEELRSALMRLDVSHASYVEAMTSAGQGRVTSAVTSLQRHLETMQELIVMPWKDYYSCQATLRQCYRVLANIENLNDGEVIFS